MDTLGAKDPAIVLVESNDHISTLPNDVLYNIFADYQILELVQCSMLSKRWRHLWISMPYLNFDQSRFTSIQACEGKFIEFITYVLLSRGESNINTLRITSNEQIDGWIASMWIQIADMRNVQKIDLNITPWSLAIADSLPAPCLAFGKSLIVLKLNLNYQRNQISMSCEQLKTLHLVAVTLPSTNFVEEILKGCPLIEDFKIERCMFPDYKVLEILSKNLKNFVFVNDLWEALRLHGSFEGVLKVVAPKLLTFVYCGQLLRDYVLGNLSSLENASVCFLDYREVEGHQLCRLVSGFSNASNLRLTIPKSQDHLLGWEGRRCFATPFYNLKQLEVYSGFRCHISTMVHLLQFFPSLEALAINAGWEEYEDDLDDSYQYRPWFEAIPCLKYHLKKINLINAYGLGTELEFLEQCLFHGEALEELTITLNKYRKRKIKIFHELFWIPKASRKVVVSFPRHEECEPFWLQYIS